MEAGAVGFSTGLEYVPGTYSPTEELVELAKVAARYNGIYASHMRDEGDKVLDAIREAAEIGRLAGTRVQISHLKQDTKAYWGNTQKMLDLIEEYRARGVDVTVDQYPYIAYSTTKKLVSKINNLDGTFTSRYVMTIRNNGNVTLGDIQLSDNLKAEFGTYQNHGPVAPGDYSIINFNIIQNSSAPLSLNFGYNGDTDQKILNVKGVIQNKKIK